MIGEYLGAFYKSVKQRWSDCWIRSETQFSREIQFIRSVTNMFGFIFGVRLLIMSLMTNIVF